MYSVDDQDRVIRLEGVPQSDIGAPMPFVISDEHVTLLAYVAQGEQRFIDEGDPASWLDDLALIQFSGRKSYMFGAPNDEAFDGHPLASRGLESYGAFEIKNSSWIRKLEQMNALHPLHRGGYLKRLKHYVFSFHDSTFECVARDFTVSNYRGSFTSLLPEMHKRLNWDAT